MNSQKTGQPATFSVPIDCACESMIACRADALQFLRTYSSLALPDGATHEDIQRAYGIAATKHFPANNPGDPKAERRFKFVKAAWAFLQAEKVIAERTETIRENNRSPLAYYERAEAYFRTGNLDRAIVDCTDALRLDRTLFCAYGIRGIARKRQGQYDKALADLNEALTWNLTYTLALQSRGDTHRLLGKHDQAVADCDEAIRLDPRFSWAYATRGAALREKKEYDRALADFSEALQLNPIYAWAYAQRGELHRLRGEIDKAIADFDEAIVGLLDMYNAWAKARRGEAHLSKGHLRQGIGDLTEAVRLDPTDVAACKAKAEAERLLEAEAKKKEAASREEPRPQTSEADTSQRKLPTHSVDHRPDCKDCDGTMIGPDTARCDNCRLAWKFLTSGKIVPADPKRCEFCGTVMTVEDFRIQDSPDVAWVSVGVACKNCGADWCWARSGHWQAQAIPEDKGATGTADSPATSSAASTEAVAVDKAECADFPIITPKGIPMSGCWTLCDHSCRHHTARGTLYCPDCLCEWELRRPMTNPKGKLAWRLTPATGERLVEMGVIEKSYKWWQRVFDPYYATRRQWWD